MSTKYSISNRTRERLRADRPELSIHAQQRWDDRMPPDARAPEWAYDRSEDVSQLIGTLATWTTDDPTREPLSALRIYAGETTGGTRYTAVFLVKSGIATVYPVAMVEDPRDRAWLREQARLQGYTTEGVDDA